MMWMETPSPTLSVRMNASCDFVTVVVEPWTAVVLVLMTGAIFKLVRIGEFDILAGRVSSRTGLLFAFAKHIL